MTNNPSRGRFITFEGGDGAGKTTQITRLIMRLAKRGCIALGTREPGGTPLANAVRALLLAKASAATSDAAFALFDTLDALEPDEVGGEAVVDAYRTLIQAPGSRIAPIAEATLHYAARADHWVNHIDPMLKAGRWVVSDRFADSTMAYQGVAGSVGRASIEALHASVLPGVAPDLTLVLDISPELGQERVRAERTDTDRYEDLDLSFHHAVRGAFLDIARREPERCVVIDASQPTDAVEEAVWRAVGPLVTAKAA